MVYVVVESLKIQGFTRLQESLLRFCFFDYHGKNVSFPVSLYFERKIPNLCNHLIRAAVKQQRTTILSLLIASCCCKIFPTAIICSTSLDVASKRGSKSKSYRTELKLQKGLTSTKKMFFSSIHHLNYFLLLSFHFFFFFHRMSRKELAFVQEWNGKQRATKKKTSYIERNSLYPCKISSISRFEEKAPLSCSLRTISSFFGRHGRQATSRRLVVAATDGSKPLLICLSG